MLTLQVARSFGMIKYECCIFSEVGQSLMGPGRYKIAIFSFLSIHIDAPQLPAHQKRGTNYHNTAILIAFFICGDNSLNGCKPLLNYEVGDQVFTVCPL
jgi:hypothetical protein